jgi:hypothetical protein
MCLLDGLYSVIFTLYSLGNVKFVNIGLDQCVRDWLHKKQLFQCLQPQYHVPGDQANDHHWPENKFCNEEY